MKASKNFVVCTGTTVIAIVVGLCSIGYGYGNDQGMFLTFGILCLLIACVGAGVVGHCYSVGTPIGGAIGNIESGQYHVRAHYGQYIIIENANHEHIYVHAPDLESSCYHDGKVTIPVDYPVKPRPVSKAPLTA